LSDDDAYELLNSWGGTYLRDPVRGGGHACQRCAKPVSGYRLCYDCNGIDSEAVPAATGFLTYAASGTQAGRLMHSYKQLHPPNPDLPLITLLLWHGSRHLPCAERIVGAPVSHISTVPSTQQRAIHPLRDRVMATFHGLPEHPLTHVPGVSPTRKLAQADLFTCEPLTAAAHVLLVDDTWTSGNKIYSATTTLRRAGAGRVTTLCIARWLSFDFMSPSTPDPPAALSAILAARTVYNIAACPFTGTSCP